MNEKWGSSELAKGLQTVLMYLPPSFDWQMPIKCQSDGGRSTLLASASSFINMRDGPAG